jgi:hypothetical protein
VSTVASLRAFAGEASARLKKVMATRRSEVMDFVHILAKMIRKLVVRFEFK